MHWGKHTIQTKKENSFQSDCLLNDSKTQAKTFNKIGAKHIFMHGQHYASFSRVRNFDCDKLLQRTIMFTEIKFCYSMES